MPLDFRTQPLSPPLSAQPDCSFRKGFWRRLASWFHRQGPQKAAVPTSGEILHMDDWMLKDIGVPHQVRDLAAQARARQARAGWDEHIW